MVDVASLEQRLKDVFAEKIYDIDHKNHEITMEVKHNHLAEVCLALRDDHSFQFNLLVDICGVDYADFGRSGWPTEETTARGFSRGVDTSHSKEVTHWNKPRFAVVYHLLSVNLNQRLRLRVFPEGDPPALASVIDIWPAADWYEREAFDLFGILFLGHPDLRRILTDYGFIGHPFRKDFPLIGNVEMRYDATIGRCVYEPVSIQPRVLVPKVIRTDNRYIAPNKEEGRANG